MEEGKTKEKGTIKSTGKIVANGITFLNGENCIRHFSIPAILLNYNPPDNSHPFAKPEKVAFWFKLEDANFKSVVSQLNPSLRELTIWFDSDNVQKLKEFLKSIPDDEISKNEKQEKQKSL